MTPCHGILILILVSVYDIYFRLSLLEKELGREGLHYALENDFENVLFL